MSDTYFTRNFSIIAHVDHGKSTLADCMIKLYGKSNLRHIREQMLDSMDLERERGITIKSQVVSLDYKGYTLNLLDTPGHADFNYEVTRSIKACEGVVLLVDAVSGVQAQTVTNWRLARDNGLVVIPVVNKIDALGAQPNACASELATLLDVDISDILLCSAKKEMGIEEIIASIVEKVPAPHNYSNEPLQARVIDSWFDKYLGITSLVRIHKGSICCRDDIKVMRGSGSTKAIELGCFLPERVACKKLKCGDIGYISIGHKEKKNFLVGDTIIHVDDTTTEPLERFDNIQPKVYTDIYPVDGNEGSKLKEALESLTLNDSSVQYKPVHSPIMGYGFNCGFLGMLHIEIFTERLQREYNLSVIVSQPTVSYYVRPRSSPEGCLVSSPLKVPTQPHTIDEPRANATIIVPQSNVGSIYKICNEFRGIERSVEWGERNVVFHYDLPMLYLIKNFSSALHSATKGYGSFEYQFSHFSPADIKVLRIFINDEEMIVAAQFVHKSEASTTAHKLVTMLENSLDRCQFNIKIQAVVDNKVLMRGNIKPYRKDVTSKCYGGDASRRKKLLEKQKKGKSKMKQVGKVAIKPSIYNKIIAIS